MHRFFKATWFWITLKVLGWGFLAGYLLLSGDWRVSPFWALGVPAVSFFVAWLFVGLKLFDRIPKLNGYLLYSDGDKTRPTAVSSDDWALKQAAYLNAGFRWKAFLSTPAEDGLICVPILLAGIGPLSAMLGGVAFGCLHLARYTYMECIGKSITYAIVCYFFLPHGVLTVALGHVIMNGIAFAGLQIARRKLPAELRTDITADPDARVRVAQHLQ